MVSLFCSFFLLLKLQVVYEVICYFYIDRIMTTVGGPATKVIHTAVCGFMVTVAWCMACLLNIKWARAA